MTTARPPDIVLIMSDQQRYDQVGYASDGHFETPVLDALAARGVVFEHAYSASTVCVPARNALLTGIQPHRLPAQENGIALREGCWTVAHALRRAGYETALIGKMHFAPVHAEHGFETMRLCEHLNSQGLGPLSRARGDEYDEYHDDLLAQGLPDWRFDTDLAGRSPFPLPPEMHPTAWIERQTIEFLERRDRERPLFLVVSFPHPHAPYNPPEPYASMYAPEDSILPDSGFDANGTLPLVFQLALLSGRTRDLAADEAHVRSFLAVIRGLVRQIDDAVGRILARLEPHSTVIAYTVDHGDYAGHRGLLRKVPWMPFEDLARVPFVIAGPGVAGGRRVTAPVQSCDFALTALDYAGVAPPDGAGFETRSLRAVLEDPEADGDPDRIVACGVSVGWPAVRRGRFKYMEHDEQHVGALFDLDADPGEQHDLATDPEHVAIANELAAEVHRLLAQPELFLAADAEAI